jgi:hypothetical protein
MKEYIYYGIVFAAFYIAGMISGYQKAKKKYRGY